MKKIREVISLKPKKTSFHVSALVFSSLSFLLLTLSASSSWLLLSFFLLECVSLPSTSDAPRASQIWNGSREITISCLDPIKRHAFCNLLLRTSFAQHSPASSTSQGFFSSSFFSLLLFFFSSSFFSFLLSLLLFL